MKAVHVLIMASIAWQPYISLFCGRGRGFGAWAPFVCIRRQNLQNHPFDRTDQPSRLVFNVTAIYSFAMWAWPRFLGTSSTASIRLKMVVSGQLVGCHLFCWTEKLQSTRGFTRLLCGERNFFLRVPISRVYQYTNEMQASAVEKPAVSANGFF